MIAFAAFVFGVICGVWGAMLHYGRKEIKERIVADEVFAKEMADTYETREARRVERPLYDQSVAGVVFIDKK